jgi:hypothetical protein
METAARYYLPGHVYVCSSLDVSVLLDLRSDRYIGLDREQTAALATIVSDWPVTPGIAPVDPARAAIVAGKLVSQGLLTTSDANTRRAVPEVLEVRAQLVEWDVRHAREVNLRDLCTFAMCFFRAKTVLSIFPFERIVRRAEQRKLRGGFARLDVALATDRVRKFRALRPFFYTVQEQCLLDSLVLLEFLAAYNLFPTWVIGIRTIPFAAHSWVQIGDRVLNGAPTYVRAFKPILVV